MNEWHITKSKTKIAIGLVLIASSFVWITYFYVYASFMYSYTTPEKFTVWFAIMVTCLLFFWGFCMIFDVNAIKILELSLIFPIWSLGLLVLPIPKGYEEAVLGSYFLLWVLIIALYFEYEKYKKKRRSQKGTEKDETH